MECLKYPDKSFHKSLSWNPAHQSNTPPKSKQGAKGGPNPIPHFRSNQNKLVFNILCQIKVFDSCSWRCPGTSVPNTAQQAVLLFLQFKFQNWGTRLRPLKGRCVSSKSLLRVWDWDDGVVGRNEREYCHPEKGSMIYHISGRVVKHSKLWVPRLTQSTILWGAVMEWTLHVSHSLAGSSCLRYGKPKAVLLECPFSPTFQKLVINSWCWATSR